jgi:hypothetical protein
VRSLLRECGGSSSCTRVSQWREREAERQRGGGGRREGGGYVPELSVVRAFGELGLQCRIGRNLHNLADKLSSREIRKSVLVGVVLKVAVHGGMLFALRACGPTSWMRGERG